MAQRKTGEEDEDIKIPDIRVDIPDYPNWRRGIVWGLGCAIPAFAAAYLTVPALKFQIAGIFAVLVYLGVGGILAFKPPK